MERVNNADWFNFQERIKSDFRKLGLYAETNLKLNGARGQHDIDVTVISKNFGFDFLWLVEAKYWKSNIPKEKVAAFISIVSDLGADKGFIISKVGFQSGAKEMVNNTNILLLTYEEFLDKITDIIYDKILLQYKRRVNNILIRYYSHPKRIRIDYNLRHERFIPETSFSVNFILQTVVRAISQARKGKFPIDLNTHLEKKYGVANAVDFNQLVNWLNENLNVIDEKLLDAEHKMMLNGDYKPELSSNIFKYNYVDFMFGYIK